MVRGQRLLSASLFLCPAYIAGAHAGTYIERNLTDDKTPSLYTGDFGNCLDGESESRFQVARFGAAFYADNLTTVFYVDGNTSLSNESLLINLEVAAYGEDRYQVTFDPCVLNLSSLCRPNASVPITEWAKIPVGLNIPLAAFTIPDFEGVARLRFFAGPSETEVGCFQAALKNGNSLSHPGAIGPLLVVFTLVAMITSFASAARGPGIIRRRKHHVHSLPVFFIIDAFQTIFFTGALAVDWPPICVAWWSNFAWAAGLINMVPSLTRSIRSFSGAANEQGHTLHARSHVLNPGSGFSARPLGRLLQEGSTYVARRVADNTSSPDGPTWAGHAITPGMPLPGTLYGLAGTLSGANFGVTEAVLTALVWVVIIMTLVVALLISFKVLLEVLGWMDFITTKRFVYFRRHWFKHAVHVSVRGFLMAFPAIATLTLFHLVFVYGPTGVMVIVSVAFGLFVGCAVVLALSPCRTPENDTPYLQRYRWLARLRKTRWAHLSFYLLYLLCRSVFLGAAAAHPQAQIYGLLAFEIIAFWITIILHPFQGRRNTVVSTWTGLTKVVTTALTIPLLPDLHVDRMAATVFGILIIAVQALLVADLMVLVVLSCFSTWFSVSRARTRPDDEFGCRTLAGVRARFLDHVDPGRGRVVPRTEDAEPPPPYQVDPPGVGQEDGAPSWRGRTKLRRGESEDAGGGDRGQFWFFFF
ncbi:hypothetical protein QBC39DRAFT_400623 [Podospora conica]|nr:hypothetical protein QBC39DRAFT_400623 [Schizothecium conicum]